MATLDKVKLYRNPDGTFIAVYTTDGAVLKNEEHDDAVDRLTARVVSKSPELQAMQEFTVTKNDLRAIIASTPGATKRHVRIDTNGQLYLDMTWKSDTQKLRDAQEAIKVKLRKSLDLTEEELTILLGKV